MVRVKSVNACFAIFARVSWSYLVAFPWVLDDTLLDYDYKYNANLCCSVILSMANNSR